jgi:hypothetical protein
MFAILAAPALAFIATMQKILFRGMFVITLSFGCIIF